MSVINNTVHRIRSLLKPGESFSQRVAHAGFWAFTLRVFDRLVGLARMVVLAHLLAPKDFGVFGIALLAMAALETFSETGFEAALIQRKGDVKSYLDTAWSMQIIRGIVLAAILALGAPLVATFFREPHATPLLRALSLAMLANGFRNVGVVYLQKELEFRKQFAYKFSGTLANLVVAVLAAYFLRNPWALIFGLIAGSIVQMLASYVVHPYRPRPRLEGAKARELYIFGKWILGCSIIVFLATQGDNAVVGKMLGATALGLYVMAFRLSNLAATEVSHVISQVTFPAYSRLQDTVTGLSRAFVLTVEATSAISLPLAAGTIMLAPDFVRLFLGDTWMPMVVALQILAVSGMLRSISATGGALFRAVGHPELDFWLNIVKVGVMAALIYPLTARYGIEGTAISVAIGLFVTMPIWWIMSSRTINTNDGTAHKSPYIMIVARLLPSIAGAGIMCMSVALVKWFAQPLSFVGFFLAGALAAISCLGTYCLFWKKCHSGPFMAANELMSSRQ